MKNRIDLFHIRPAALLLASLLLASCATATPYQPLKRGVGYSDQKLEANRFRISFSGGASTTRETVENYILYRSAELTLANGFDYFTIAAQATDQAIQGGGPRFGFGLGGFGYSRYAGWGIGFGSGTDVRTEYQGSADVAMYRGKKPEADPHAYDAREITANLEPTIARPKAETP